MSFWTTITDQFFRNEIQEPIIDVAMDTRGPETATISAISIRASHDESTTPIDREGPQIIQHHDATEPEQLGIANIPIRASDEEILYQLIKDDLNQQNND